jgi:hypothetical protein
MSVIAFSIVAAAAVSSGGQSLVCHQAAHGAEAAKEFRLAFGVKGGKLGKIILEDSQAVLDPLADVPVLTPASRSGPLVLNQSAPPPRKPMRLAGRSLASGGFEFVNKVPALRLELVPVVDSQSSFTYSFQGNRLLSGVMRMGYDGNGSCAPVAASPGAQAR